MRPVQEWLGPGSRKTEIAQVAEIARPLKTELAAKARIAQPTEDKMFINVACGTKSSTLLEQVRQELEARGIISAMTKGPLVMKTVGKTKGAEPDSITIPMALQGGSTYAFLHRVIDKAYERLRDKHPDMDLRLGGDRDQPHFAHNTWRRMEATAAEAALQAEKCTTSDVDMQELGWNLRKYAKMMRLHYAERGARACRAGMSENI